MRAEQILGVLYLILIGALVREAYLDLNYMALGLSILFFIYVLAKWTLSFDDNEKK